MSPMDRERWSCAPLAARGTRRDLSRSHGRQPVIGFTFGRHRQAAGRSAAAVGVTSLRYLRTRRECRSPGAGSDSSTEMFVASEGGMRRQPITALRVELLVLAAGRI